MKINRRHSSSQSQVQARLEALKNAHRKSVETVQSFPEPPSGNSLFKSELPAFRSVDELVTSGNQSFENLDNVDFAGFRNNKELGEETLQKVKEDLIPFHADRTTEAYRKDLSRVMNARYLQGHGVQVEGHLDAREMRSLRKYIQKETSTNNVADAVRAINTSLADGEQEVSALTLNAEKYLFSERGVSNQVFEQKFAGRDLRDLEKVRDFSDAWSTSQGGKFLNLAEGADFSSNRDSMARAMLSAHGYQGLDALDLDTVLSLLRDIDGEGPRTNATVRETVNKSLAKGVKDYFRLSTLANQAILRDIGMPRKALAALKVSNEELTDAFPKETPRESRAVRTRVLRDLLRVLPAEERQAAIAELGRSGANLINAEKKLKSYFGRRIAALTGGATYGKMGAMQRANFTAALSKLPKEVREKAFAEGEDGARESLEKLIEEKFGIEIHREAGKAPDGSGDDNPYIKDWPVQGLVDLYNAMSGMAKNGRLPNTLKGNTTVSYVEGSGPTPSMAVGPQPVNDDPVGPWNQPGAWAHASGTSGYFGMCDSSSGHDLVYFCDDALKGTNADSADSVTIGESTLIHEFGHAIQLGGTPGAEKAQRDLEQQTLMAEWSALSEWKEPDQLLADGRMGTFEYYYDPTVQVGKREQVATSYGA
ncbi:MAG: hypothetical protein KC800_19085, partial [Candidatus Eremiobacteraeota bacterium]|nr:hypothetical protein [Candidatus Eremiobacteraeota bacterium]